MCGIIAGTADDDLDAVDDVLQADHNNACQRWHIIAIPRDGTIIIPPAQPAFSPESHAWQFGLGRVFQDVIRHAWIGAGEKNVGDCLSAINSDSAPTAAFYVKSVQHSSNAIALSWVS